MGLFMFAVATAAVVWIARKQRRKSKSVGENVSANEGILETELKVEQELHVVEKSCDGNAPCIDAAEEKRDTDAGDEESSSHGEPMVVESAVDDCVSEEDLSVTLQAEESVNVAAEASVESNLQPPVEVKLDLLELNSDGSALPDTPSALSVRSTSDSTRSTRSDLSEAFEEILELLSQADVSEDEGVDSKVQVMEISPAPTTAPIPVPSKPQSFAVASIHDDAEAECQPPPKLSSSLGTSPMGSFFSFARRSFSRKEVGLVDNTEPGTVQVMGAVQAAQMTRAMSLPSLMNAGAESRRMSVRAYPSKTRGLASLLEDSVEKDVHDEACFVTRLSFKKTESTS